jgi:flagellar motor switch protein FliN/FliY
MADDQPPTDAVPTDPIDPTGSSDPKPAESSASAAPVPPNPPPVDATQASLDALAGALGAIDAPPLVGSGVSSEQAPASAATPMPGELGSSLEMADQAAIDELLKQANFEDAAAAFAGEKTAETAVSGAPSADTAPFELPNFQQVMQDAQVSSIELLRDVELNVKIELGRSRMLVEDVLKLAEGSVVELDKLAGDPVDVFVNERLVARGEVLVLNDNFCVRVNEIVAGTKEEGL